jgi:LemA protein
VIFVLILVALVVLVGVIYVLMRNSIIASRNRVEEAWSGIDVQLKRRHDLVPSLVESVRGHATFERGVLEDVTRLRGGTPASRALQDGENALSAQLRGLLAVAEAYPQLRAGESFLELQKRLAEVENHLQMARRYYNGTVRDYNTVVESFPSNVVAGAFGFALADFFQVESAIERAVPEVRT